MTIKNLLLNVLQRRALRPKSRQTYKTKIEIFCQYLSKRGVYRLLRVTRKIALDFLDTVSSSPTTRNTYRDTLRSFFADLIKEKRLKVNPFADIDKVTEDRKGLMYFTDEQVSELAEVIAEEHPTLWMACRLLYYCFIRNTEQLALPCEDMHLQDAVIRVHASYAKNHKTQPVVIPDEFLDDLREWYAAQRKNGCRHFITYKGKPIARGDWFTKQHNKILRRLGYSDRYSFYSWKHTGAVKFYRATRDLKALQLQLRHHSLDQVDEYLRELGVIDNPNIRVHSMPLACKKAA